MSALRMFVPITKVDAVRRCVYGVVTAEKEDRAGEICDYASTKPLYEKWSAEIAKSTRGKSLGNLRAMHGLVAAGKVTAITFNDPEKQIEICAKVVDDAEWMKVQEGVYTGFSQGGSYERRWTDAEGRARYTAVPTEISLVDLPCLPEATFEMIKADGTVEQQCFGKGADITTQLTSLIQELDLLLDSFGVKETSEQKQLEALQDLRDFVARATEILQNMASEKIGDYASEQFSQKTMKTFGTPVKIASLNSVRPINSSGKVNDAEKVKIQHLHDTSVELGAACGTQKMLHGGLEKRFDVLTETLADVLRRVKNIEEQPLPLPLMSGMRAVSKTEDCGSDSQADVEKLLSNPDVLSVLAIKLAQRNRRSSLR